MNYFGYKLLLSLLKIAVYLKRSVFWCGRKIKKGLEYSGDLFSRTIGFRFYKVRFFLKKRVFPSQSVWSAKGIDFLGSRGTLQVVLLGIFLYILFPESAFYKTDSLSFPGRKTVLYALVGPGDQDFEESEEIVTFEGVPIISNQNWREGTIQTDTLVQNQPIEISGISGSGPGGTSLVKPNILPGVKTEPETSFQNTGTKRNGVTEYVVKNGDVIGDIARRFGVSVNTILWANNLTVRSYIRPGDTLKVLPGTGVLYTVKKGDTLSKIASRHGVESVEIASVNGLPKNGTNISIGMSLFIPGGTPLSVPTPSRVIVKDTTSRDFDRVAAPPPSINVPAGSGYVWPTTDRRINQYFGLRHTGVDIAGKTGNPNYAVKAGTVIKSQCGWNGGYGCYVIVDHGGGVTTLYGHNDKLLVDVGEWVEQGQSIGLLGNTGRSTGPHLHFEVRIGRTRVNPLKYVR